jgi:hypothetical protein
LNKTYIVQRRYSDFEWLLVKFHEREEYKGLSIPPLPCINLNAYSLTSYIIAKQYFGSLGVQFIDNRK